MTESGGRPPGEDDWGGPEETPWQQQPPPPQGQAWQGPGGGQQFVPPQPAHGAPQPGGPPHQQVPNYLLHSILATVLCCLPTGIVGIVYATQVNSKLALGDVAGAQAASQNARLWTIISVVAGLVVGFMYFVYLTGSGTA